MTQAEIAGMLFDYLRAELEGNHYYKLMEEDTEQQIDYNDFCNAAQAVRQYLGGLTVLEETMPGRSNIMIKHR